MSDTIEKAFGIDLGTTYSCIAHIGSSGKPEIINNFEGDPITPSVVFPETPENIVVGKAAKGSIKTDADRIISFVKREMGNKDWSMVIDDTEYVPETVSAAILKKLALDASTALNEPVKKVVITCPAYFGQAERLATENAGKIAGLEVLRILDEPIAAALSYGINPDEEKTVLVYDLGGGTFDVTLVAFRKSGIEIIASDGDHELGGKNWDDALVLYFINKFMADHPDSNIANDVYAMGEFQTQAEITKQQLSGAETARASFGFDGKRCRVEITRAEFEDMTADRLLRTITLLNKVLEEGKKKGSTSFDELILVGGSTRMAQVMNILKKEFPDKEPRFHDPDQAVAKGAAILANNLAIQKWAAEAARAEPAEQGSGSGGQRTIGGAVPSDEKIEEMAASSGIDPQTIRDAINTKIVNAVSKSFGIVARNEQGQDRVFNLVWKNDRLPLRNDGDFALLEDNQQEVLFRVRESGYTKTDELVKSGIDPDATQILDENTLLTGIPSGQPKGTLIQVTFSVDEAGILKLFGSCCGQMIEAEFNITSSMTKEEVEQATNALARVRVSGT